jgi:hypothetical protein
MRRIKKGGQRFSINIKRFYDVCDPNARACGSQWKRQDSAVARTGNKVKKVNNAGTG